MHSIPHAMIWEFWHKGRWQFLLALVGGLSLPMLLYSAMLVIAVIRLDFRNQGFVTFYFAWFLVQAIAFGGAAMISQDNVSRLYQRPITTWSIVTWRLVPGMATTALLYATTTGLLNGIFHLDWPFVGPVLFLACSYPIFQAAIWLGEKAPVVQVALMSFSAAFLGMWLRARHGGWLTGTTHFWTEVTYGELLTLLTVAIIGWSGCYVGVRRDRCGDNLNWLRLYEWLESWSPRSRSDAPPYRSAATAQFAYEWRQKGWLMPLVVVIGFSAMCLVLFVRRAVAGPQMSDEFGVGFVITGVLLPIIGLLVGMVFGQTGGGLDKAEMGTFLGSRPVEDQQFSWSILWVAALSTLVAWGLWVIPVAAIGWWLHPGEMFTDAANRLYPSFHSHLLWPLPLTWLAAANSACAMKTGRIRLMAQVLALIFLSLIGWFFLAGPVWKLGPVVYEFPMLLFGAAAVAGTIYAYVRVLWQRLIVPHVATIALATWLVSCTFVETLLSGMTDLSSRAGVHPATSMFVYGVLSLVVAPVAFGPLAIAWNRHR